MQPAAQHCTIGLDVGGTKIAGGVVALPEGRVLAREVIPTGAARGGPAVLADARALVERLWTRHQSLEIAAIGIGIAELVAPDGAITSSHTIGWQGIPVAQAFADLAPTVIEADVRAAAIAEACFGAGRDHRLWVYVTVGTGISSCLVQDGQPLAGARGNALVMANSPLSSVCPACGTHVEIILEEFASGPALAARYTKATGRATTRGEEVLAAAAAGEAKAVEIVRTAGEALGNSVAFLANVLDPEAVVVGGGLGQAEGLYWTSFEDAVRRHIWADTTRGLPVLHAMLGPDAGFIGAAVAAWRRVSSLL
jgi:glucokinase